MPTHDTHLNNHEIVSRDRHFICMRIYVYYLYYDIIIMHIIIYGYGVIAFDLYSCQRDILCRLTMYYV